MKAFIADHLLPVFGVLFAITSLTLAFFEVPAVPPSSAPGMRVPPSAEVSSSAEPIARTPAERARVDDTLTRVLRTLDDGRRDSDLQKAMRADPTRAAPPVKQAGPAAVPTAATPATTPAPAPDPKLLDSVSALANAVRAIHDARSEEDLMRAEELVKTAREQMESSCASSSGPLCASAEQIKSLGY
ncbi:MAG TPA: hypothetical protein VHU80_06605 [Polyangiaceae bacterium]|nr:hypothetical protein [Polyangiaceae bacterium]